MKYMKFIVSFLVLLLLFSLGFTCVLLLLGFDNIVNYVFGCNMSWYVYLLFLILIGLFKLYNMKLF